MKRIVVSLIVCGALHLCVSSVSVKKEQEVDIYSYHIDSKVNSRYAITVITSRVANRLNESREVQFHVKIPKNAFISKFNMVIEGKTYDGIVKQKEEAQQQYNRAVARGESGGIISSVGRTLEDFKTSVTVAALSKVTFELTYEELLKRRLGKYKLQIHAQPMQPVADFKIGVYINENQGISLLEVKGELKTQELSSAVITTLAESTKEAWVNFNPTTKQQSSCDSCNKNGLNGDLIIDYDVKRENQNGELQAMNGFFVHFFAPTDIQQIPKNVVFLIDRSGSMRGKKILQTQLAMVKILEDLGADDYFGLITFDSSVHNWKPELLPATETNLEQAKSFVREIEAKGGTNINEVLLNGVEMIKSHPRQGSAAILILLTDGDPTSGEINTESIQTNIKEAIGGTFPLYCLGFGFDVKFDFLEKMALENDGVARRIYEASDADLQLQGFYEEVATPLLTHVHLKYPGAVNLTQTSFRQYYNGSEIVVSGQITDNNLETLQSEIMAVSNSRNVTYQDSISVKDVMEVSPEHENFIQRLWAYLTVKQLLDREMALNGHEKEEAKKKALDLSLKYKFVTPLTSMVVTKPQEEETQVAHKPKEGLEGAKPQKHFHQKKVNLAQQMHQPSDTYRKSSRRPGSTRLRNAETRIIGRGSLSIIDSLQRHTISTPNVQSSSLLWLDVPEKILVPKPATTDLQNKTPSPVPPVRFLIFAQPKPVCFNAPVGHKLRLLSNTSSEFYMNGELSEKGFQQIAVHYRTADLLVSPTESVYSDGKDHVKLIWGQSTANRLELDSASLFLRDNELDVTMGPVRVIFLLHKKDGEVFLWPSVRHQLRNGNTQGILGIIQLQYEELPDAKLKMADQEVVAQLSSAIDYTLPTLPSVECWLVPFQSVLQGELFDFTVSKL